MTMTIVFVSLVSPFSVFGLREREGEGEGEKETARQRE